MKVSKIIRNMLKTWYYERNAMISLYTILCLYSPPKPPKKTGGFGSNDFPEFILGSILSPSWNPHPELSLPMELPNLQGPEIHQFRVGVKKNGMGHFQRKSENWNPFLKTVKLESIFFWVKNSINLRTKYQPFDF